MSDRIDPYDLPHVVLGHVDTLLSLLGPLRPAMDPGGHLTTHEVDGKTEDTLTELGFALAHNAARVANDACLHLSRTAGHMKPDIRGYRIIEDLHYDAAHNLAMVERALGGIQGSAYPVGVTEAAHALLSRFRERCQAAAEVARDLGGEEPSATVDAEEPDAVLETDDDGSGPLVAYADIDSVVFELQEDIPEIGGRPGDRLIMRPTRRPKRPCVLVRDLGGGVEDCKWAMDHRTRFLHAKPPSVRGDEACRYVLAAIELERSEGEEPTPTPDRKNAPHHPALERIEREGGYLRGDEIRAVLLDAYRPLATYLDPLQHFQPSDDPVEAAKRIRGGLPLAKAAVAMAWRLYSYGSAPGVGGDWIHHADLLLVVRHAMESVSGAEELTAKELGNAASAMELLVRSVYEELLAEEKELLAAEEVAHV